MIRVRVLLFAFSALIVAAAVLPARAAEPLSFRRSIELAVHHASDVQIANADLVKAHQNFLEGHDLYYPQVTTGAGLGYSHGFPLSLEGAAPSIFNLNASSLLINLSQHEFNHAARTEWKAAESTLQDKRNDVILDAASSYLQLDKTAASIKTLQLQLQAAQRIQQIETDRVKEGIDPETELTRAQLGVARAQMAIAKAEGDADVLREHLSALTGLPEDSIVTDPETIPNFPDLPTGPDVVKQAVANSPAVKSAEQHAQAEAFRARGEHRANLPMIDFAAQYAVLSRFNNYDQFFLRFERNNATIGVVIRFPFLNFAQKARAEGADADARKAQAQADQVKEKVSSDTLRLEHMVEQLTAAREVARLEHELALSDIDTAQAKIQSGTATAADEQNARAAEAAKYSAYLDAAYNLDQAELQLLRQTGDIEKWALGSQSAPAPQPQPQKP